MSELLAVTTFNHSESGWRLVGKTGTETEKHGVGQKDSRVALQQITLDIMNIQGEENREVVLVINLEQIGVASPSLF